MTRGKALGFWTVLLVLLLGVIEGLSFVAISTGRYLFRGEGSGLLLPQPDFEPEDVASYFATRNPILGWPSPNLFPSDAYDESGARPNPLFPYPAPPCVATFGDSFTYGSEVGDADAWATQLSRILSCRVANFGVGGYGTDQAYIRFRGAEIAPASVVILGIFPDNIMRNVSSYRGFLVARHQLAFKPRFLLSDRGLEEVPILSQASFDQATLAASPDAMLPHEYFLPDTAYGPVTIGFPYSWAALRAVVHPRARAVLMGAPSWVDFYEPGHPSRAFEVTTALVDRFVADVQSRGKTPLVYVFTNAASVKTFASSGIWPYQRLLDFLKAQEHLYVHAGDRIAEYVRLEDACTLFTGKRTIFGCNGHFTPEGNRMVAEGIHRLLKEKGLMPSASTEPLRP